MLASDEIAINVAQLEGLKADPDIDPAVWKIISELTSGCGGAVAVQVIRKVLYLQIIKQNGLSLAQASLTVGKIIEFAEQVKAMAIKLPLPVAETSQIKALAIQIEQPTDNDISTALAMAGLVYAELQLKGLMGSRFEIKYFLDEGMASFIRFGKLFKNELDSAQAPSLISPERSK